MRDCAALTGEDKFRDRAAAGRLLASQILMKEVDESVVVAIPNGGLPVAAPIARRLGTPLKACVTRRVRLPDDSELSVGTVDGRGALTLDLAVLDFLAASDHAIETGVNQCRDEVDDLSTALSGHSVEDGIAGSDVLLVDDVVATGNSVLGAILYLESFGPRSIQVAAPVVSLYAARRLVERHIRFVTMLIGRGQDFRPGNFYADFSPVDVTAWDAHRENGQRGDHA